MGVVPSVVYLAEAPDVALEIVTLCAPLYMPPVGVITGAVTVPVMVNANGATALSTHVFS